MFDHGKSFYLGVFIGIGLSLIAYAGESLLEEGESKEFLDPNTEIVFGDPNTPCHVKQTLEEHLLLIDFDKTMSPKINAMYMAWPYLCMESEGAFEEAEQQ